MQQKTDKILDELLIVRLKDNDRKALSLLVKRWHNKLIWQSYQVIKDTDEAQDIVQDSWQAIIAGIIQLKDISSYKSWMYRIIRNKSIDRIRQLQRERKMKEGLGEEVQYENTQETSTKENEVALVRKFIEKLPHDLKEVLTLFYLNTQSVDEISGILGVPKGTVKSRLFRAREQLKEQLLKQKELDF